jgi:hypothetical protein
MLTEERARDNRRVANLVALAFQVILNVDFTLEKWNSFH